MMKTHLPETYQKAVNIFFSAIVILQMVLCLPVIRQMIPFPAYIYVPLFLFPIGIGALGKIYKQRWIVVIAILGLVCVSYITVILSGIQVSG